MNSNNKTARIAGLIYLCVIVCGTLYLGYIPSRFKTGPDSQALVQHIAASESLFRLGILSELICGVFFLILPVILYKLLRPVHETGARLMVVFAVVSVPVSYINLLNKLAVLSLINRFNHLKEVANDQLHAQVAFYLDLYSQGILVNQLFWGLWLFPFGYLVFKSKFLPKILGILLMAGCFGYLIDFFGSFFAPQYYNESPISGYMTLPASLGEIGSCLWLLIAGVKNKKA